MSSQLFNNGFEGLMDGSINLISGDIRAMMVRSTYTFDAADEFIADLGSVDNGRSGALAGKSVTDGVFDANDTSIVASGANAVNALIIFQHTGNDATARLIAYIDGVSGMPFTPAASQTCNITWDNTTNKIFKFVNA